MVPRLALTDITIRSLKPGTYYDLKTPAFGIRVGKTTKTWFFTRSKAREKVTVGHYPDLGLSEARTAAKRLMVNPKTTEHLTITFSEARDRYLREHTGRPRTKKELERLLTRTCRKLTTYDLGTITDATVEDVLKALPPSEALHAFRALRALFRWSQRPPRRFITTNPLEGYAPPATEKSRDRVLTPEELKAIWHACPDNGFGNTVRLLILTGQRRGEIPFITLEGDLGHISGSHTKNGRAHTFPMPSEAQNYTRKPLKWSGWGKSKERLDRVSKVAKWTLHDIRRTYATIHAQLGTPPHIIEALLNHKSGIISGVAATYNRYQYIEPMREAVRNFEVYIQKVIE